MLKPYRGKLVTIGLASPQLCTLFSLWLNRSRLQGSSIQPVKRVFTFVTVSSQIELAIKYTVEDYKVTTLTEDSE